MRVRKKLSDNKYLYGHSSSFNVHAVGEVVCYFDNDSCESEFISDLEVEISSGVWKSMQKAFADKDIIENNLNTAFDIPHSEVEREQGYNNY